MMLWSMYLTAAGYRMVMVLVCECGICFVVYSVGEKRSFGALIYCNPSYLFHFLSNTLGGRHFSLFQNLNCSIFESVKLTYCH